jgi:hypothetical protein
VDARLQEKLDRLRHIILQEILHGGGAQHLQVLLHCCAYLLEPNGAIVEREARALGWCAAVSAPSHDEGEHVVHARFGSHMPFQSHPPPSVPRP